MRKKVISIDLAGGIGNQLFRYFAAHAIGEKLDASLKFYFDELPNTHSQFNSRITDLYPDVAIHYRSRKGPFRNLCIRLSDSISYRLPLFARIKLKFTRNYYELGTEFQRELSSIDRKFKRFPFPLTIHLKGHFQNIDYFMLVQEKLLKGKLQIDEHYQSNPLFISGSDAQNTSCLVHVRRGDFKNHKSDIGLLDSDYYRRSMKDFLEITPLARFVIISDDVAEAKKFLPSEYRGISIFVEESDVLNPALLFRYSIEFKNFIISNSTYSLWIALLSEKPSYVAFPFPFNFNLEIPVRGFPVSWRKIESSFE